MKRTMTKPVLKSGKSSIIILPKWWCDLNGIKVGDEVLVEVNTKFVVIKPIKRGANEVSVKK